MTTAQNDLIVSNLYLNMSVLISKGDVMTLNDFGSLRNNYVTGHPGTYLI